jgi:hypothetical protein
MLSNAYMDDTCRSIVIFFLFFSFLVKKFFKMQVRPLGLINVRKKVFGISKGLSESSS